MAKSSEYKLKILYILKFLMEETDAEHPISTKSILEKLEKVGITAERKSVYDDVAALQRFGIAIEHTRELGGGYYIAERDFELPELKLLVDAVQSSKFVTKQKSSTLIKKLASLTNIHDADKLNRQVYMAGRIKTMNESIYYNVDMIHTAIIENVQITFKYFDWTPQKEKNYRHNAQTYRVSPWALCWEDENYYMLAYDAKAGIVKHFRVDKLSRISYTDFAREGAACFKNFDLGKYSNQVFGMFRGELDSVTLKCDNSLAGVIIDRFGEDVSIFPKGDHFLCSVSVMISNNFLSWVMQFGSKMQIVSPNGVVEKMKALIKEAGEMYQ